MFFFFLFSYSTNNYLQIDYVFGTVTKPGTTNGYRQSATITTIQGRRTATTATTTTATAATATSIITRQARRRRQRW